MPIITTDLIWEESTNGLGGVNTEVAVVSNVLHNLFDIVNSDEALLGDVEYRCLYVKNNHASLTLENAKVYINSNTASNTTEMQIGLGSSVINGLEQSINSESDSPIAVAFSLANGIGNALVIGDIPPQGVKAIWFMRDITENTAASSSDGIDVAIVGDTGA